MKTTILAGLLALTSGMAMVLPTTAPTQAASLSIEFGEGGRSNRYDDDGWRYRRHDRGLHRGWYKGERRAFGLRRAYRECEVTTHRYWRHGRLIVERERNCF